jgi:hypothetical protein
LHSSGAGVAEPDQDASYVAKAITSVMTSAGWKQSSRLVAATGAGASGGACWDTPLSKPSPLPCHPRGAGTQPGDAEVLVAAQKKGPGRCPPAALGRASPLELP